MTDYKSIKYNISGADLTGIPTSAITSGTFADARISSSSVSQHATSFDDNKIVNDLSTLGLRVHTQENLNASNSNSASFDVFQDSSGVSNLVNVSRNTDYEYMAAENVAYTGNSDTLLFDAGTSTASEVHTSNTFSTNNLEAENWVMASSSENNLTGSYNTNGSTNVDGNGKSKVLSGMLAYSGQTSNDGTYEFFGSHTGSYTHGQTIVIDTKAGVSGNNFYLTKYSFNTVWNPNSVAMILYGNSDGGSTWTTLSDQNPSSTGTYTYTFSPANSSNTIYRYLKFRIGYTSGRDVAYRRLRFWGDYETTTVSSATGSFTGNNITTPSSVNNMGAVITYQDNAWTNALNTDIVLQLSADGGSNYSTATLTTLPDFATGIKIAKVNDLSVTAGTSLKYKISFANQSTGSKEARIRGVSLQY